MDSDKQKASPQSSDNNKPMSRLQVYRNLIVIGILNLFQYSATNPTNALITSTAGKTLGSITFFLNFFFTATFSLLSIPVLKSRVKEKEILWINNIALITFTIGNLYISYYTLIPASFFHGFAIANTFVTSLVYVKKLAAHYAEAYKLNSTTVISLFGGILLGLVRAGFFLGNATASVILTILQPERMHSDDFIGNDDNGTIFTIDDINGTKNYTNSDGQCHTNDDAIEFTVLTMYVLRGVIIIYSLLALLTTAFLDDFDKYQQNKCVLTVKEKITDVIKLLWPSIKSAAIMVVNKKMFLTIPLFITIGVTNGFMYASYAKASWLQL